ncbi:LytTR family transcriptional regulator DNA-binding domain-containing protein [Pseudonocardia sp. GCM10023141]|uniref:LytTR family transcriptional regulator DNA-binding domain-containing protein n=1 Tax=Pseudonocardia sp. GCM10023141 TaxID=3252653 RepID=UPI00361373F2
MHRDQNAYGRSRHGIGDGDGRGDGQHRRQTLRAWERFVSGDDDVQGVSPAILLSWYRCRDVHRLDPGLHRPLAAPLAAAAGSSGVRQGRAGVYAQLGGIAAAIARRSEHCLTTVTDGDGRILASWGPRCLVQQAAGSHLPSSVTWSESAAGTNGMGTAITGHQPVVVRGPEHWCRSLHEWTCVGMAVYDAVTDDAVAAVNIATCGQHDIAGLATGLAAEVRAVQSGLHDQAREHGLEVARAFLAVDRRTTHKLLAVDVAGNVIAANDETRSVLTDLPKGFLLEPGNRWNPGAPQLRRMVARSGERLRADPAWVGSADVGTALLGHPEMFRFSAVTSADGVIGWVLSSDQHHDDDTVALPAATSPPVSPKLGRVPAVQGDQVLLLDPAEIRYAEAARHVVWFVTDLGRVRAATPGMDNIDAELAPFGFLRVHRSYLVNVDRIRRIGHPSRGTLTLSTDPHLDEEIPVARRNVARVKVVLGI